MSANGILFDGAKETVRDAVNTIPIWNLAIGLLPAIVVLVIVHRWSLEVRTAAWALVRMLVQLFAVGYVLVHIFKSDNPWLILAVLTVMLSAASWIALGPVRQQPKLYKKSWFAIAVGGGLTLALITQGVLRLEPWFAPRFIIPLGGMIFANAMNAVSISAERFYAEISGGAEYRAARQAALRAALIPLTNSLLAVGIVSLPGMMTGQILSGVDPLVAATYQIMVMGMVFGSGGISAACFLTLLKKKGRLRANHETQGVSLLWPDSSRADIGRPRGRFLHAVRRRHRSTSRDSRPVARRRPRRQPLFFTGPQFCCRFWKSKNSGTTTSRVSCSARSNYCVRAIGLLASWCCCFRWCFPW